MNSDLLSNVASFVDRDTLNNYSLVSVDFHNSCFHNLAFSNMEKIEYYCKVDDINRFKLLFDRLEPENIDLAVIYSIRNNRDWLFSLNNIYIDYSRIFKYSCKNNYIDATVFIYNTKEICVNYGKIFKHVCYEGYFTIAKWLYSLNVIDKDCIGESFSDSCSYNHLDMAKWLYSLGEMDVAIFFTHSCKEGYFDMAVKAGYFDIVDDIRIMRS